MAILNQQFSGQINKENLRINHTFMQTLVNEGKEVVIGEDTHVVFFRRNEGNTVMYAPTEEQIQLGTCFTYENEPYLILDSITDTNVIYNRYLCTKCTEQFKIQFPDKVIIFNTINNGYTDKLNTNSDGITTTSRTEFIVSLTDDAKRISINERFMCGYNGMAFKVSDIHYNGGLCYLYCERDVLNTNDDKENMLCDAIQTEPETPTEPPIASGDIVVTPPCENPSMLVSGWGEDTFTCSIEGVDNPIWVITAPENENLIFSTSNNTFTCECIYGSNELINVAIHETVSDKTLIYTLKLINFM